jgi:hypothetical protein
VTEREAGRDVARRTAEVIQYEWTRSVWRCGARVEAAASTP